MKFQGNFTDAMKAETIKKMNKLTRYVSLDNAVVSYKVTKDGMVKAEISIGSNIRASKIGEDFYEIIPEIVNKLETQIKHYKSTKLFNKKHCGIIETQEDEEDDVPFQITKEKVVIMTSESVEEAIDEMELLGHNFFVFRDIDRNDAPCIVYKRFDGTYGIMECR